MGLIKDIKDIEYNFDLWNLDDNIILTELEKKFQEYIKGKINSAEIDIDLGVNLNARIISIVSDLTPYVKKYSAFMSVTASHLYIIKNFLEKLGLFAEPIRLNYEIHSISYDIFGSQTDFPKTRAHLLGDINYVLQRSEDSLKYVSEVIFDFVFDKESKIKKLDINFE